MMYGFRVTIMYYAVKVVKDIMNVPMNCSVIEPIGQFNAMPAAVINQSPCDGDCMRQAEYIMMDWVSGRPNIDGFIGY